MPKWLRRLLTRLNILNGNRALDNVDRKMVSLASEIDATLEQLHDEIWAKAEENDKYRERIRSNLDVCDLKRGHINYASGLRTRLTETIE